MDHYRIILLGEGGVGKTALAVQTYDPTIEDSYRRHMLVDHKRASVEVIDTAGQEEFSTLRDQWIREGHGFILVYSITSRSTFDQLEAFHQTVMRLKRNKPAFILVGNKADRIYEREVSTEEGAALARSFGCEFLETSAMTSHNVDRAFSDVLRVLRRDKKEGQVKAPPAKEGLHWKTRGCVIM